MQEKSLNLESRAIDAFFQKSKETNEETIYPSTEAEVKMAMFIIQHNTFFNQSDHMSQFIRQEFNGRKAVENFACGRRKTSAIVSCIGNNFFKQLNTNMEKFLFSMMLGASNDTGLYKTFPITVHIFDVNFGMVMTKFYDINYMKGWDASTAQALFQSVDGILAKNGVQWNNCTLLGLDNTNTNIGNRNSIKTKALEKNPTIKISGCPCHVLHNAAMKAYTAFAKITKFDIEDHCVDLHYLFEKSSK